VGSPLSHEHNLADLLRRPDVSFDDVATVGAIARPDSATSRAKLQNELGVSLADSVIEQVQISIKYAGYIDKQIRDVERALSYDDLKLPNDLDYTQVQALSFEARQSLAKHRPETLGQAARMSAITPAAISLLLVHLKKGRFKEFKLSTDADFGVDA
jgi:tRNA uridine 5-carboxymethylaminomethyl modification enzyme